MNKIPTITKTFQQGDVLLKKIEKLPPGEIKLIAKGKLIIAEGEATGHSHCILDKKSRLIEIGGKRFLDLQNDKPLEHQEHGAAILEHGIWEIGGVQEFDYFSQMKKRVVD